MGATRSQDERKATGSRLRVTGGITRTARPGPSSRQARHPWPRIALALLAVGVLSCAGNTATPRDGSMQATGPTLLVHSVPAEPALLTFPPPVGQGRSPRGALPAEYGRFDATAPLRVVEPELDSAGKFSLRGTVLRVRFNQAIAGAKRDAPAGSTVTLRPAVAGLARWVDEQTLELTAAKPFDPEVQYELEVSAVQDVAGRAMAQPFKAAFRATPVVVVAGKELDYVPKPGSPRVVTVRPGDGATVSRRARFSALFDQPVELGLARGLVELRAFRGSATGADVIPVSVEHPAKDEYDGLKVDRKMVVYLRPLRPLAFGEHVTFVARDKEPVAGHEPWTSDVTISEPLQHAEVACGWWQESPEECSYAGGVLRMAGKQVQVRFNNRIGTPDKQLRGHVQVTPAIRNLAVREEGWEDGRLVLQGDFQPSTSYRVAVTGLVDVFGEPQRSALSFEVATFPLGASVVIPEGLILLDAEGGRRFPVHSRNVAEAELQLWPVARDDADAFRAALTSATDRQLDSDTPAKRVRVPIAAKRDALVSTELDLTGELEPGQSYLATVQASRLAFGAQPIRFPSGSEAERPPVALLRIGTPDALAVHLHGSPDATLVHVARLRSGEPVAGARISWAAEADAPRATTDALGVALLRPTTGQPEAAEQLVRVEAGAEQLLVPLGAGDASAASLFPELGTNGRQGRADRRAVVVVDRGIYRPGSVVETQASAYRAESGGLRPLAGTLLRVRVLGPTGDALCSQAVVTSSLGSVATRCELPRDAKLGRYRVVLDDPTRQTHPIGESALRVAEFEAPRFAVDVLMDEAPSKPDTLGATVRGRYLFGAPMQGAAVSYSLARLPAELPTGPLSDAGLVFQRERGWWDEEQGRSGGVWTRTGEGRLDADGLLRISEPASLKDVTGPQRFELEADVTDASFRHVAGRASVVRHPAARYAGLKGPRGWLDVGQDVAVELGVADTQGRSVVGAAVTARLERLSWRYVSRRTATGALRSEWTTVRTEAGRCTAKSDVRPVRCSLRIVQSGDYELTAEVDGRPGGRTSFWAWGHGEKSAGPTPAKGSAVPLIADKASYLPGERARLLVRNPYPAATAILTLEQGGLLEHQSQRVESAAALFEVPIRAAHAPYLNATVTLLPIGGRGEQIASHRIGAARIPVSLRAVRLDVQIQTSRPSYQPGEEAEVTVAVKDQGKPQPGAELALAVVDEGVLRLTSFRQPDPAAALRPGFALDFRLRDTRQGLAELLERSHVPGDGGGEESGTVSNARRNFVQTALWRPQLRANEQGIASVRFRLPDNLTEFRVMAVALDAEGRGGNAESSFLVRKPVLLDPVLPRFALVGDHFEVAAIVHNTGSQPFHGVVKLGERLKPVSVAAAGRERVGFDVVADRAGPMSLTMAVADAGGERDRVVKTIAVAQPGIEQRPRLAGAFRKEQLISLELPAGVLDAGDAKLNIQVGQHLWPELGARMDYLLDYPHGCVEQTTSGTLPLIAARDILPRIGFAKLGPEALRARIHVGIERLATMRTESGGLAYWPGGTEPNVYGTAYAMRAVVLAKLAGIEPPRGLLEGMVKYLGTAVGDSAIEPEVRAAIAQSLAEMHQLPASSADALFGLADKASVFGQSSLALALDSLGGQEDRVAKLLDRVEKAFDERGELLRSPSHHDFHYYGSPQRSAAQTAIALAKLRPGSTLLPVLVNDLATQTESYTTQATAYSLLALAEHLRNTVTDGAEVELSLDGQPLVAARELGVGSRQYQLPLASLRGRKATLRLVSKADGAVAFLLDASYRVPLAAGAGATGSLVATSASHGPDLFRLYSDAEGNPIDLAQVKAGDVVRVALLVRMPRAVVSERRGYVAVVDRLPAGFEPVDPDLATVARAPELSERHPFAGALRYGGSEASHVELRDDRVSIYFDKVWGDELGATYLARATTPGRYVLPPAAAELMYEPDSLSYSEAGTVVVH